MSFRVFTPFSNNLENENGYLPFVFVSEHVQKQCNLYFRDVIFQSQLKTKKKSKFFCSQQKCHVLRLILKNHLDFSLNVLLLF
jgi:hypothetical protein